MKPRVRVGVVFGGVSPEHEVSLASANNVLSAIDRNKFDVVEVGITKEGRWVVGPGAHQYLLSLASEELLPSGAAAALEQMTAAADVVNQPAIGTREQRKEFIRTRLLNDVVLSDSALPSTQQGIGRLDVLFPLIHGRGGEDGAIQGLCQMLNIAVVGSGVLGAAVTMDKVMTNQVLMAAGIEKARWLLVLREEWPSQLQHLQQRIETELGGYPVFVKPANTGSSVGIVKVASADKLEEALTEAQRYDRRMLIEEAIKGRELEIAVLGRYDVTVSPVVSEIIPDREFYDYVAKYLGGGTRIELPAKVSQDVVTRMQEVAVKAFRAVDGCGMARIDFFYDERGDKLYLNEINSIPGFTEISQYPQLMMTTGMSYGALIERLIEIALERQREEMQTER